MGTPDFEYYEYKGTKWLVVQGDMGDGSKRTEWYNLLTNTSDLCYVSMDDTEKKEKTDIEWTGDPTVKLLGKIQLLLYKGGEGRGN